MLGLHVFFFQICGRSEGSAGVHLFGGFFEKKDYCGEIKAGHVYTLV